MMESKCEMCGQEDYSSTSSGTHFCEKCWGEYSKFLCKRCSVRVVTPKKHIDLCTGCELQNWWDGLSSETQQRWSDQIFNGRWMDIMENLQESLNTNASHAFRVIRWIEEGRLR